MLRGVFKFDAQLYRRESVELWSSYLQTLLLGMSQGIRRPVNELPWMSDIQRAQLQSFNETSREYPSEALIHELFEEQAATTPQATALVFEEQSLSYGELNERANRLAHHLKDLGIGPDRLVALCMQRGVEMVVGLLGVLKAGGAYVPLDPVYASERLRATLEDSQPGVLVLDAVGRLALGDAELQMPVIDIHADASTWQQASAQNLLPADQGLNSKHLAYVIYTSGSTGKPKGEIGRAHV